jgi:hypothetical protein
MIQEVGTELAKLAEVPLAGWRDYVIQLQRMSYKVASIIAEDMSYFPQRHEVPYINFVKDMCEARENAREISSDIFNEFVNALHH